MLTSSYKDIKNYYRAIEFIFDINNMGLPHERMKKIILNELIAESYLENELINLRDSYLYLINNTKQPLTLEMLDRTYYLLTNKNLNEEILYSILSYYYQNIDTKLYYLISILHLKIINEVDYKNIEFAFIISNYIMLKNNRYPLILRPGRHNRYLGIIKENDYSKLSQLFLLIESKESKENINPPSLKEIILNFKNIKDELKIKYKINKLYIYGSYLNNSQTINSDLDLIIIFDDDLLNYETKMYCNEIKKYLKDILNIEIDILTFRNTLKNFDNSLLEKLIQII